MNKPIACQDRVTHRICMHLPSVGSQSAQQAVVVDRGYPNSVQVMEDQSQISSGRSWGPALVVQTQEELLTSHRQYYKNRRRFDEFM